MVAILHLHTRTFYKKLIGSDNWHIYKLIYYYCIDITLCVHNVMVVVLSVVLVFVSTAAVVTGHMTSHDLGLLVKHCTLRQKDWFSA